MSAKQLLCNAEWFDQQVDSDQILLNTMKCQRGFQNQNLSNYSDQPRQEQTVRWTHQNS